MNKTGIFLVIVAIIALLAMIVGTIIGVWSPVGAITTWQEKISGEKLPFEITMAVEEEEILLIGSKSPYPVLIVEQLSENGSCLCDYDSGVKLFIGETTNNYTIGKKLFAMSCKKEIAGNETIYVISIKEVM